MSCCVRVCSLYAFDLGHFPALNCLVHCTQFLKWSFCTLISSLLLLLLILFVFSPFFPFCISTISILHFILIRTSYNVSSYSWYEIETWQFNHTLDITKCYFNWFSNLKRLQLHCALWHWINSTVYKLNFRFV